MQNFKEKVRDLKEFKQNGLKANTDVFALDPI